MLCRHRARSSRPAYCQVGKDAVFSNPPRLGVTSNQCVLKLLHHEEHEEHEEREGVVVASIRPSVVFVDQGTVVTD